MLADTPGKRAYLIRLALGDGLKTPMTMAAFAALLTKRSKVVYDSSMISRMESGERKVTLDDIAYMAALDPLTRGKSWLAFGESVDMAQLIDPSKDRRLTGEEIQRARDVVAQARKEKKNGGKRRA